jgi:2-haloacid dehalogenase
MAERVVVFDLGGVLLDWDPRHLYRRLIDDEAAMERFLAEVCTHEWNQTFDAGRPFADGVAELTARHPDLAHLIEAYDREWHHMVKGPIEGTVEHLEALHAGGVPLFGLSNWSAEKLPQVRGRYAFLERFRHIVVSGEVGVIKPDARIFEILLDHVGRPAPDCLFIDDVERNVEAARSLGFDVVRFLSPAQLGGELRARGLPAG